VVAPVSPKLLEHTLAKAFVLRILIVESHEDNREALRLVLTMLGHEVNCAQTGRQGLVTSATWHADIVVLDLGLPDIPGERVAEAIKEWPSPPFIIAFSGFNRRERPRAWPDVMRSY
jgi:CheY-like chemotaxis protein